LRGNESMYDGFSIWTSGIVPEMVEARLEYFADSYFTVEAGVEHHTEVSDRRLKIVDLPLVDQVITGFVDIDVGANDENFCFVWI